MKSMSATPRKQAQRGGMLMMSIFVMIIISLLGLALTKMLAASGNAIVYEVYGVRALYVARAGLEHKLTEVFPLNASGAGVCEPDSGETDVDAGGVACSFTSKCEEKEYSDSTYYRLSATGTCIAGNDVVISRTLKVDAQELNN